MDRWTVNCWWHYFKRVSSFSYGPIFLVSPDICDYQTVSQNFDILLSSGISRGSVKVVPKLVTMKCKFYGSNFWFWIKSGIHFWSLIFKLFWSKITTLRFEIQTVYFLYIDALKYSSMLIKLFNRFLTEIEIRITKW